MQFRTELTPDRLPIQLRLTDKIVTIGSCFAEVMGNRLADHKLSVHTNPLGTLFNPFSISKVIRLALTNNVPDEALYVERDGLWFHYDAHSSIWGHTRAELAATFTSQLTQTGETLRQANWLLLTLGSAVVYEERSTQAIVANCHKMPGTLFNKHLCGIDPVRSELTSLLTLLHEHNPGLQVVLTVSPVRHVRDGLTLNSASKSLLRVLCAELTGTFDHVHYFPAYELVQDDLRDYRFYEADLIHPNAQAHDYVFSKFADSAFSPDLCAFVKQWAQIRRALAHRPLHGLTDAHRLFLQKIRHQIDALPASIDTTAERAEILNRLL
ncbi:GSCFA domain-containing protein [Fibrella sp. ES10-3-2-2]|nr:hypothetical protein A6C57_15200 [Fibrella sp. ES10-3-2-2]